MGRTNDLVYALNAGGVDPDAIARVDLEKMRMAGEHPVRNWLPRVLGPMTLRGGLEFKQALAGRTRDIPFIRSRDTKYSLGMSAGLCTVNRDGVPVIVAAAGTAVVNPGFVSGGGGWSDVSDTGAGTDGTATLPPGGVVALAATSWRSAAVEQAVAVALADRSTEHTLRITIRRGPVFFRVGSAVGGEEVVSETRLTAGVHKLTFTPDAAVIYIRFRSEDAALREVERCEFEHTALGGSGPLTLPTPWGAERLAYLSWDQSADVLFIADGASKLKRIERRGDKSWSIVDYISRGGPLSLPLTEKVSLNPGTIIGNGAMVANRAYFKPSHVGALFELTHTEQNTFAELNGADQATDHVTVRGLFTSAAPPGPFNDRNLNYSIDISSGSFVGTIALERSTDADASVWSEVKTFVANATATFNDEQSNLIAHYRFRAKEHTSGFASVSIGYPSGSKTGLVRVTGFTNSTSVDIEVVKPLGASKETFTWRGPSWSDDLGWPRVPRLFDSRLWWFKGDVAYGSVVDDFDNFDDGMEGDAAPIIRSIGNSSAEGALWALDMQRLIVGTTGFEASIRSSSFDEPITPTQFTVRNASTLGSALIAAVKHDRGAFFVQASARRLYELLFSGETSDYTSQDVSRLNPAALDVGAVAMAIQRQPDTRLYVVLEDGSVVVLTYERDDKVVAFTTLEAEGIDVHDVCVLPASDEDEVYLIGMAGNVYTRFKLSPEAAQRSADTCNLLDNSSVLVGAVSSITGASRLEGQTVQVWADGRRRSDVVISGGAAALGATYARVVYGKAYDATFKSVKLAYAAQAGSAIGQTKIVRHAGLILSHSTLDGLRVGKDAGNTDPMPDFVDGSLRTPGQMFAHYDADLLPIQSDWSADSRIYLMAHSADGPKTVMAVVLDVETRDGAQTRNG